MNVRDSYYFLHENIIIYKTTDLSLQLPHNLSFITCILKYLEFRIKFNFIFFISLEGDEKVV